MTAVDVSAETTKTIGFIGPLPANEREAFQTLVGPKIAPQGRDILVAVRAVSVNPVDVKLRSRQKDTTPEPRLLGCDANGIVDT